MDRTQACGACNVGSIPAGSTNVRKKRTRPLFSVLTAHVLGRHASGIESLGRLLRERKRSEISARPTVHVMKDSCREWTDPFPHITFLAIITNNTMDAEIEKRFANVGKSKTFKNIVAQFNLDTKAVLDIGCSYGEFVAHFGPGSVGVTITPEEVTYGKKRGLDIRYGNIEDKTFELKETFDVIFANNIFEHLYSPHQFLIDIKKYLREDGILILGVPCMPILTPLVHIRKFRGSLAVAHINFFTRDTLIKTTERGGWTVHATRGYHFAHPLIDHLLDLIYPHFYVSASPIQDFHYSEKRMKELAGYADK